MSRKYICPITETTCVMVHNAVMETSGNIADGTFINDDSEPDLGYGGEKDGEGDAKSWHFSLWDDDDDMW